jgi:hypothetical protein
MSRDGGYEGEPRGWRVIGRLSLWLHGSYELASLTGKKYRASCVRSTIFGLWLGLSVVKEGLVTSDSHTPHFLSALFTTQKALQSSTDQADPFSVLEIVSSTTVDPCLYTTQKTSLPSSLP